MPRAPQPRPYPGDLVAEAASGSRGAAPTLVRYVATYQDAMRRPLQGSVTITPHPVHTTSAALPPAPITVDITGVLDVPLLPGTYDLVAHLRTAEQARVTDRRTITITEETPRG
jgi:hypothetical protein